MANNDEDKAPVPAETPEQVKGRRHVGWTRALLDLSPPLEWIGADKRRVRQDDVGKTVWDIVSELMEERYAEIERGEPEPAIGKDFADLSAEQQNAFLEAAKRGGHDLANFEKKHKGGK